MKFGTGIYALQAGCHFCDLQTIRQTIKSWSGDRAWTDGQRNGGTSKASASVLPGVQWSPSIAVFRTIQLVPVCARPDQSIPERSNWIGSKWSLSSGGLTVSRVHPARANNQPEWLTGSFNVAQYAESFKSLWSVCVCVCVKAGVASLFIH